jgi:SAM-dependent methyltransferase
VERLPDARASRLPILDLGCGTGAAGLAWAAAGPTGRALTGVDLNPWALGEASAAYRHFGVRGRTVQSTIASLGWPRGRAAVVAAFAVNELAEAARATLLTRLLDREAVGDQILIIEPLAKGMAPWWGHWQRAFEAVGGRADEWRFRVELPPIVVRLGRAARLHHHELTGRSLWCGGARSALTVPEVP